MKTLILALVLLTGCTYNIHVYPTKEVIQQPTTYPFYEYPSWNYEPDYDWDYNKFEPYIYDTILRIGIGESIFKDVGKHTDSVLSKEIKELYTDTALINKIYKKE